MDNREWKIEKLRIVSNAERQRLIFFIRQILVLKFL
jgi:hypothetical protein